MNRKTIIIIDPLPKLMPQFINLANEYQDILYTVSVNKEIIYKNNFKLNLFDDLEEFINILDQKSIKPDIIFSLNEYFAKQVEYLNEYYNLESTQNNFGLFREKSDVKKLFQKYNIPHARGNSYSLDRIKHIDTSQFNYPVIVKPSGGYASAGVKKVNTAEELKNQIRTIAMINAFKFGRDNYLKMEIIIEEYLDGPEFCCDSLWKNGECILTIIHRNMSGPGPDYPDWLYYIDPFIEDSTQSSLIEADKNIHHFLNTQTGFTHTEYKIVNDIPFIIETTNRPGAGGEFFSNILESTSIDVLDIFYRNIIHNEDLFHNLTVEYDKNFFYFFNIPQLTKSGKIVGINGIDELKNHRYVSHISNFIDIGSYINYKKFSSEYSMMITGKLPVYLDIVKEIKKLDSLLDVEIL